VYVGWIHDLPELKEKYTPETPTPGVKGHGLAGNWLLHACSSISSFEPATTMLLWLASTATAGSFCLFCENGDFGLVLVTFTEPSAAAWAASAPLANTMAATDPSTISRLKGLLTLFFLLAIPRDLRYPGVHAAGSLVARFGGCHCQAAGTKSKSPAARDGH
jgi:hypothetical protein